VGEGFSRLAHYVERQGDARVPASFTADGYPPGSWVDMQRNRHTKGALNVDRERRPRDLTGLDLGPEADHWRRIERLYDHTMDNRGPFAELRDWKGNLDHDLVVLAKRRASRPTRRSPCTSSTATTPCWSSSSASPATTRPAVT
jgi:hypothetical protein